MNKDAVLASLTDAEKRVFFLAITHLTTKEIATELDLAVWTVKHHLTKIFVKTKKKNRMDLASSFNEVHLPLIIFQMQKKVAELEARLDSFLPRGNGN